MTKVLVDIIFKQIYSTKCRIFSTKNKHHRILNLVGLVTTSAFCVFTLWKQSRMCLSQSSSLHLLELPSLLL